MAKPSSNNHQSYNTKRSNRTPEQNTNAFPRSASPEQRSRSRSRHEDIDKSYVRYKRLRQDHSNEPHPVKIDKPEAHSRNDQSYSTKPISPVESRSRRSPEQNTNAHSRYHVFPRSASPDLRSRSCSGHEDMHKSHVQYRWLRQDHACEPHPVKIDKPEAHSRKHCHRSTREYHSLSPDHYTNARRSYRRNVSQSSEHRSHSRSRHGDIHESHVQQAQLRYDHSNDSEAHSRKHCHRSTREYHSPSPDHYTNARRSYRRNASQRTSEHRSHSRSRHGNIHKSHVQQAQLRYDHFIESPAVQRKQHAHYRLNFSLIRTAYKLMGEWDKVKIINKVPKRLKDHVTIHDLYLIVERQESSSEKFDMSKLAPIRDRLAAAMISIFNYKDNENQLRYQWKTHGMSTCMALKDYFQKILILGEPCLMKINITLEELGRSYTKEEGNYVGMEAAILWERIKDSIGEHTIVCKEIRSRYYVNEISIEYDINFNTISQSEKKSEKKWLPSTVKENDTLYFRKKT